MLNLENNLVSISRNVIFHEQHIPFHISKPSTSASTSSSPFSFFLPTSTDHNIFPYDPIPQVFQEEESYTLTILGSDSISDSVSDVNDSSSDSNVIPNPTTVILRKIIGLSNHHFFQSDYVCGTASSQHWCHMVTFSILSVCHKAFTSTMKSLVEPTSYQEAIKDLKWLEAMNKELQALQSKNT